MICSGNTRIQYHNSNCYKKDGVELASSPIIINTNTSTTTTTTTTGTSDKSILFPYEIITRGSSVQEQIAASLLLLADSTTIMSSELGKDEEVSTSGDTGSNNPEAAPAEHSQTDLTMATQASITSRVIGQEGTNSKLQLPFLTCHSRAIRYFVSDLSLDHLFCSLFFRHQY